MMDVESVLKNVSVIRRKVPYDVLIWPWKNKLNDRCVILKSRNDELGHEAENI